MQAESQQIGSLQVIPLSGGAFTATDLAERIMGGRGTISNAVFTGSPEAAGKFIGGASTIGIGDGVVLSSGAATSVVGPNLVDNISTDHGRAGEATLDGLVPGGGTLDAAVLEFDMTPSTTVLRFDFVFASDEYNEYANTQFNDVFGFFINGQNVALLPDGRNVTVDTVNGGNPLGTNEQNPDSYHNNDLSDGGPFFDTEMDGFTDVLSVRRDVSPGETLHVKLAIADVGDHVYDSNVFIGSPEDCGAFNTDAATVEPDATDPPDAPNITVRYDPRSLVPENQPDYEAKARRVAEEVRKRADLAIGRYRQLGLESFSDIEIRIVCDIQGVQPLNIDDINIGPINVDLVPEGVDGLVQGSNSVLLRAAAIRNEFKTTVQQDFPAGGDWSTPRRYWVNLVDHELFHTVQFKKVGPLSAAEYIRGASLVWESGAMLGTDLPIDADNLARPSGGGSWPLSYLSWLDDFFTNHPSLDGNSYYSAAAVFQYWGERFGDPAASMAEQVARWYMRLVQSPSLIPPLDPDVGLSVMAEVLAPNDLYDALRDFYVAAYGRRADNVFGQSGPGAKYRFLDEEDVPLSAPYPNLDRTDTGDLAAGPVTFTVEASNPLKRAAANVYEINVPSGTSEVRVSFEAQPTGGIGPFNWFPGTSPARLAFIPFAPDPDPGLTIGTVDLDHLYHGPRPDQGALEKTVPVGGRSKIGIVVIASQDDAAYTLTVTRVVGTADLAILSPTTNEPAQVAADSSDQSIVASVRPTVAGAVPPGLGISSFIAHVGATQAAVTAVVPVGDHYLVLLDPETPLGAGTYPLEITYSGVTKTVPDGVVVTPAGGAAATTESPAVRVMLVLEDEGQAGTPIHAVLVLSEPGQAIAGATVVARVTDPTGRSRTFNLVDDAANGDTDESDGVYGAGLWATDVTGTYDISVTASGVDSAGSPFSVTDTGSVTLGPKVDADGDGVADLVEPRFGLDPAVADGSLDHDGDGLGLADELREGTNPWRWDTDGSGENDASELAAARDPLTAADDGEVRTMILAARSIDGRQIAVHAATNDGLGSVRLYRLEGAALVSLGTFPGSGGDLTDGPLPAGSYSYAAVAIGPSGAESAPTLLGPRQAIDDATLPSARLVVESGRWETSDRDVSVAFLDVSEPLSEMRLAESAGALANTAWVPYAQSTTFTLDPAAGEHRVYAQVRDVSGLASPIVFETIDLDAAPPASQAGPLPGFTSGSTLDVPYTASDGGSFVADVELWVRYRASLADAWGAWGLEASSATSPIPYPFANGDGYYEFYTIAIDGAGTVRPRRRVPMPPPYWTLRRQ
jgi:hypothetical protein